MRAVMMYAFFIVVTVLMISLAQDDNEQANVEGATWQAINYNIECVIPEINLSQIRLFFGPHVCQLITAKYFEATRKNLLDEAAQKIYLKYTIDLKPLKQVSFRQKIISSAAKEDHFHIM